MTPDSSPEIIPSLLPPELSPAGAKTTLNHMSKAIQEYYFHYSKRVSEAMINFATAGIGRFVTEAHVDLLISPWYKDSPGNFPLLDNISSYLGVRLALPETVSGISPEAARAVLDLLNQSPRSSAAIQSEDNDRILKVSSAAGPVIEFNLDQLEPDVDQPPRHLPQNLLSGQVFFNGTDQAVATGTHPFTEADPDFLNNRRRLTAAVPDVIALTGQVAAALNQALGDPPSRVIGWKSPNPGGAVSYTNDGCFFTPTGEKIGTFF
jgi:hypothetical protein